MDVQTDKGQVNFMMHWSNDRAVDYGRRGKIIIDVNDNRYLIPTSTNSPNANAANSHDISIGRRLCGIQSGSENAGRVRRI